MYEQEELQQDVERVVELACRNLPPADQNLLRWIAGIQNPVQPKDYAQEEMPLGWGGPE